MLAALLACAPDPVSRPAPDPAHRRLQPTGRWCSPVPRPRNLLMISIDTTRRDHVAPYAPDGGTRRSFSAKMAEGALDAHQQVNPDVRVDELHAPGPVPRRTGLPSNDRDRERQPPRRPALARGPPGERGYATVLVSGNGCRPT